MAGLGAEAAAADCLPPDDGPPGQRAPPDARPSGPPQVDRNQVLLDAALSFRWQRSPLLRTAVLHLSEDNATSRFSRAQVHLPAAQR